jgi:hypothetical protein
MKIARTDHHGSIRLVLEDDGGWRMTWTGPSPKPAQRPAPGRTLAMHRAPTFLTGNFANPPRSLPARRTPLTRIPTASTSPPPPVRTLLTEMPPGSPLFIPPPPPTSLGDILKIGSTKEPSFGDIIAEFLKASAARPKTPAEEFTEWLLRQQLPPK